ncbi:MAG: helix-turn-helix domain-containing protein, partial [Clostridia bacterium]|nr:helix-turn-helix domain-containing protein [Clostridia bacterium]
RQNITNFKAGRTYPSIETLYLICECLEVSADYLLGLEDETGAKINAPKYHIGTLNNNGGTVDMK